MDMVSEIATSCLRYGVAMVASPDASVVAEADCVLVVLDDAVIHPPLNGAGVFLLGLGLWGCG